MGQHLSGLFDRRARVACLGDSITYGFGLPDRESECYPSQLQSLLKTEAQVDVAVDNFGVSGACMNDDGDLPYRKQVAYIDAVGKSSRLAAVVVMLGTNDCKKNNWDRHRFLDSFRALLDDFSASPQGAAKGSGPAILICRPPPLFLDGFEAEYKAMLEALDSLIAEEHEAAAAAGLESKAAAMVAEAQVLPRRRREPEQQEPLAAPMGRGRLVCVVDVHSALASEHLFPDYVHPGAEGALRIATEVERVLTATVPGTWSFSNRTRERV